MPKRTSKLLACNALAHALSAMTEESVEVTVLDIGLHVAPDRLRARILAEIAELEEEGTDIILGYGLCGRSLEGVVSAKSRLILPRVDDCVGALLGSRERHRQVLGRCPGCYFLAPHWLDTELNIFTEIMKGMERIPAARRHQIVKAALKHYDTLAILVSEKPAPGEVRRCETHAREFGLQLIELAADLTLLHRLVNGPWTEADFILAAPGEPIPFF